jgi:hypothetical protein
MTKEYYKIEGFKPTLNLREVNHNELNKVLNLGKEKIFNFADLQKLAAVLWDNRGTIGFNIEDFVLNELDVVEKTITKRKLMRHYNLTILIAILVTTFTLGSCNQANKLDDKDKALIEKENELLKKERLKKEQELNQKTSKTTTDNSTIKEPDNSTLNNLDFLKKLNGKYPWEVKLFNNSALMQRLKKLLGNSRFNFLKETWYLENPMEFTNNIFVASGCEQHNCGSTNFIIVYDFSNNVLYAGIREQDKVKTYSEDGSNSPKVNEWENGT